ncbi:hypothetical protein Ancab_038675 [Ancistrocladus abbreviatus]
MRAASGSSFTRYLKLDWLENQGAVLKGNNGRLPYWLQQAMVLGGLLVMIIPRRMNQTVNSRVSFTTSCTMCRTSAITPSCEHVILNHLQLLPTSSSGYQHHPWLPTSSASVACSAANSVCSIVNSINAQEPKIPPLWLAFNKKVKVNAVFLWDSTRVLLLFGGNISSSGLDGRLKMMGGYLEFLNKPALADMYFVFEERT